MYICITRYKIFLATCNKILDIIIKLILYKNMKHKKIYLLERHKDGLIRLFGRMVKRAVSKAP